MQGLRMQSIFLYLPRLFHWTSITMPYDPPLNSLGLPKPPPETRVVVAMSGGVDSSVGRSRRACHRRDMTLWA